MADFTLTVPDTIAPLVTECLCLAGGHTPTGDAATDAATAKQVVIDWITQTVENVQTAQAPPPPPPAITPITGLS
jgi:hypothetical protein